MAVSFTPEHRFARPRKEVFDAHVDLNPFSKQMISCTRGEKLTDGTLTGGTLLK